jgi:hypothetical protein
MFFPFPMPGSRTWGAFVPTRYPLGVTPSAFRARAVKAQDAGARSVEHVFRTRAVKMQGQRGTTR